MLRWIDKDSKRQRTEDGDVHLYLYLHYNNYRMTVHGYGIKTYEYVGKKN
jgi:hypothetical protein